MYIEEEAWNAYPKCKTGYPLCCILLCQMFTTLVSTPLKWALVGIGYQHLSSSFCSREHRQVLDIIVDVYGVRIDHTSGCS